MTSEPFDIAIIGAGPVGSTLALGLGARNYKVALIDTRPPGRTPSADGRNFAIVTGSWRLLSSVGVTSELESTSQKLHGLEAIDGGGHWLNTPSALFQDQDLDVPGPEETLGHMVMANALQGALDAAVNSSSNITVIAPDRFVDLNHAPGKITLALESGRMVDARLAVGADGVNSPLRNTLGIETEGRDYNKSVFTANVHLSAPHNGIARQLFMPEGPFATLPLPGQRANLAWYLKRGAAETLAALPVKEAEAELNHRFAEFAGPMRIDGKAGAYPLILQVATQITADRAALIGDAARRVNPLAGQGLNQGFRDVGALIDFIDEAGRAGLDVGSAAVLEKYSAARRFEGLSAALALDGIDRLFSNDHFLTKPARGLGLLAAKRIPALRQFLARKASATEEGIPESMSGW